MSLPRERQQNSIFDVAFVAEGLFEEGSPYRIFREKALPGLRRKRAELAKLYREDNGRPAIEPVVMAGALLLQFMEKAPDRKAASELKLNLGWKYALDLQWDEGAVHPASLAVFRRRLIEGEAESLVFDAVLESLRAEGLVRKRSKQRIDSTHVVAAVSHMCRLEVMWEALRLCLEDVREQSAEGLPEPWQEWTRLYLEGAPDLRELKRPGKMVEKLQQTGLDAQRLLDWLEGRADLKERPAAALLRRVFDEQYEVKESELQVRRVELAGSVQNPHDPEAEWAAKDPSGKSQWVGYKAQVTETVAEDGEPRPKGEPTLQFVTGIVTTEATASDQRGLQEALEAQASQGLEPPSELYADAAYVHGRELSQAEEQGRELVGPIRQSPHRDGLLPVEEFDVRVQERKATCPAGKTSTSCSRVHHRGRDERYYQFKWGKQCDSCPLQAACAGGRGRRILRVGIYHDAVQRRRREMKTAEFQRRMRQRKAIEGTISELVRGYGLRKTRYRGLAKTRLANLLIGAACNVNRWARLVSRQAALAA